MLRKEFRVPTSVESFAVCEERELEEQSAQKICSTHYAGHLIEMERERTREAVVYIKKQRYHMLPFINY